MIYDQVFKQKQMLKAAPEFTGGLKGHTLVNGQKEANFWAAPPSPV